MLTLHNTAQTIRMVAKWSGITLGSILLIFLFYKGGKGILTIIFPKKPPAPTVAYGKLPPIIFPLNTKKEKLTYTLDTVSGTLPEFNTDRLRVFPIMAAEPNLLNLENTRKSVANVGFTQNENLITDTVYQWTDAKKTDKKIIRNIVSNDFTLSSNFLSYPEVLTSQQLPSELEAKKTAISFLESMNLYPEDIDDEKTTTQLLAIQNSSVFEATSLSTANIIRVDFFQKNVDDLPIYYPKPPYSTINLLIGGGDYNGQVLQGQYYYQKINLDESATYPIKTANEALKELESGKGYIANYFGIENTITINEIFLAYYLGEAKQQYLMPIIVFKGKDGFFGYISAVKNEWLNEMN